MGHSSDRPASCLIRYTHHHAQLSIGEGEPGVKGSVPAGAACWKWTRRAARPVRRDLLANGRIGPDRLRTDNLGLTPPGPRSLRGRLECRRFRATASGPAPSGTTASGAAASGRPPLAEDEANGVQPGLANQAA